MQYSYQRAKDMIKKEEALKLKLLLLDEKRIKNEYLMEVTGQQTVIGTDINPKGLNSTITFGPLGSDRRLKTFAYINLNIEIMHPRVYDYIITLSPFYKAIIEGRIKARFDRETSMFMPDDNGETGYNYFIKYIQILKFPEKSSTDRQSMLTVIKQMQKSRAIKFKYLYVIPPLYREVTIEEDGSIVEHEMNELYRTVLSTAIMLKSMGSDSSSDAFRLTLQRKVNEVFEYLITLIDGKKKAVLDTWASRSLDYGTRNVITGKEFKVDKLDFDTCPIDYTMIGTFQFVKSIEPYAIHSILRDFFDPLFNNNSARLFNSKTKEWETTTLPDRVYERFTTPRGINKLINTCIDTEGKNRPLQYKDYYIIPVLDENDKVTFFQDVEEKYKEMKIRPLTYGELLYLSIYNRIDKTASTFTRYPVVEQGSDYPALITVDTTNSNRTIEAVFKTGHGEITSTVKKYPNINETWDDSLAPSYTRLAGLDADFDGDKTSHNSTLTEEAFNDVKSYLSSRKNLLNAIGKLNIEIEDTIVRKLTQTMTR